MLVPVTVRASQHWQRGNIPVCSAVPTLVLETLLIVAEMHNKIASIMSYGEKKFKW